MDLTFITEKYIFVVLVACLIVGYVIKNTPAFNKAANSYIPLIVAVLGAVLGCVANGELTLENIVYGSVSGLASTGLHQIFSRLLGIENKEEK